MISGAHQLLHFLKTAALSATRKRSLQKLVGLAPILSPFSRALLWLYGPGVVGELLRAGSSMVG